MMEKSYSLVLTGIMVLEDLTLSFQKVGWRNGKKSPTQENPSIPHIMICIIPITQRIRKDGFQAIESLVKTC
jgi:hypothetical protein